MAICAYEFAFAKLFGDASLTRPSACVGYVESFLPVDVVPIHLPRIEDTMAVSARPTHLQCFHLLCPQTSERLRLLRVVGLVLVVVRPTILTVAVLAPDTEPASLAREVIVDLRVVAFRTCSHAV
jgi:hypothetical protein